MILVWYGAVLLIGYTLGLTLGHFSYILIALGIAALGHSYFVSRKRRCSFSRGPVRTLPQASGRSRVRSS